MSWRQGDGYLQSKQSILLTSLVITVYIAIELHLSLIFFKSSYLSTKYHKISKKYGDHGVIKFL